MKFRILTTLLASICTLSSTTIGATTLLTDGTGSYGQIAMARNDDGSSSRQALPFSINFYGQSYNSFFVNNNGNITFGSQLGSYTPYNLGTLNQAMIAPYWADVDTRCSSCGNVYVGGNADFMSVTWSNVGYYSQHSDKTNDFQLNLYKVGSTGDFDIEFRYNNLEWTTGDASGGLNGLGGTPAVAGYTNGNGVAYLQPGSFLSPGALNMAVESNVSDPGRWVYNIRNAVPPPTQGSTPSNPILPTAGNATTGYTFTFNVSEDRVYYVDPPVATGYDFAIDGGLLITSAIFTTLTGDTDGYQLFDANGNLLGDVAIGQTFNFANPLNFFSLRGIRPDALLNPADPLAFVSGFTFSGLGTASIRQIPFVEEFAPVPESSTWAMLILGFGFVGATLRRRRSLSVRFA